MFDLLLAADYMTDQPDAMAATLVETLGLPSQDPKGRRELPDHAVLPVFLRVNESFSVAPTMLETVGYRDVPNPRDPVFPTYLRSLELLQGSARPMKTHGTVLATSRMDELMDALHRRKVPFRLAPITEAFPGDRIWIGSRAERPEYDPSYDGGLMVEVIALNSVKLLTADDVDAEDRPALAAGSIERIVHRGFVVRDLDAVSVALARNLGFEPDDATTHPDEGFRRLRYTFGMAESSTLDVLSPLDARGPLGRYVSTWGPGPYYVRIAVRGLDAKGEDLARRRVRFDLQQETSAAPRRIVVDPTTLRGALVEFVEFDQG